MARREETDNEVHTGSITLCGSACTALFCSFAAGSVFASARGHRERTSRSQSTHIRH